MNFEARQANRRPAEDSSCSHLADEIAKQSVRLYNNLPRNGKPLIRSNGVAEWTTLATICLVAPREGSIGPGPDNTDDVPHIVPISLGTGVKVLPINRLPPMGDALHDSHAEIIARRGFIRWLLHQAQSITDGEKHRDVLYWDVRHSQFRLKAGIQVWLYVSTLPCGDASTLYTAAHQPPEMAALKDSANGHRPDYVVGTAVRGRNGYENYGAIRTKPGRADSTPSISFSCSDKIASWSIIGLQGGLLAGEANLFEPVRLKGVVIGGMEDPSDVTTGKSTAASWREKIRLELERALWGRLECIEGRLNPPYQLHRPAITITRIPFPHSRDEVRHRHSQEPVTSVTSISHLPDLSLGAEVLFNGCRQGASWKPPGKTPIPPHQRSRLCKLELLESFHRLVGSISMLDQDANQIKQLSYYEVKHPPNSAYQHAKAILRGKVPEQSAADDSDRPGSLADFAKTSCTGANFDPPFRGWLVSGRKWENFTVVEG